MTTGVQLIVAILLSASVSSAYGQASTNLALPSNARANVLKVLPNQSVRAVSNRNDFLYLFNSSGQLTRTVDLNENRTSGTEYGDFDLWVNAQGDIFVLSVWKDQALKSGVLIYDNQGNYQRSVLLGKPVVARRILVDASGDLIVAGLSSDRYFGRSDQLFLLHKYRADGTHVRSFLPLDTNLYDSSGSIQNVYRTLYPLVDLAAVGICPRGIFAVVPGTRNVNFYHPSTLALTEVVALQAPSGSWLNVSQGMTDEYGQLNDTSLVIRKLQVTATGIEAEFLQSRFYGSHARRNTAVACRYNQYGNLLSEYPVKYRESGTLIRTTGTTAYASVVKLRTRDGNSVLIRSD